MKKWIRCLVVAVLALCLTEAAAFAADTPIAVQLDGEDIAFTDAVPVISPEGRTFVPFRAVFEGMGATVDYDNGVVTAERDGKTVVMTLGSTEASVTENGVTTPVTMDVAPYQDASSGVWRTYVPVRFAAQALGANVGWDADARTVVIVDVEKQVDAALEGRSFTYLEKLLDYSRKYNEGVWSSEMSMKGAVSIDTAVLAPDAPMTFRIPVTVSAKGVTADGSKLDVAETMTIDLSSLNDLLAAALTGSGVGESEIASVNAVVKGLADKGVVCVVRGDLSTGMLYVNYDLSALGDLAGLLRDEGLPMDGKTWYAVDIKGLYAQLGVDLDELLSQMKEFKAADLKDVLAKLISAAGDMNDAGESYAAFDAVLKTVVNALADDGFVRNGNVYTSTVSQNVEGIALKLALSLTMRNDAAVGYGFEASLDGDADGLGAVAVSMKMSVNERDQVTGSVTMDALDMVKANFDITGAYNRGSAAPVTEPPADAAVIDLMQLIGELPAGT